MVIYPQIDGSVEDLYSFDDYWSDPPLSKRSVAPNELPRTKRPKLSALSPQTNKSASNSVSLEVTDEQQPTSLAQPAAHSPIAENVIQEANADYCQNEMNTEWNVATTSKQNNIKECVAKNRIGNVEQPLKPKLITAHLVSIQHQEWMTKNGIAATVHHAVAPTITRRPTTGSSTSSNLSEVINPLSYAHLASGAISTPSAVPLASNN
jgi:hypothetical protein